MMTVKDVSKLTGVSVRTLHHYDKIGLLKPATYTAAGYRLYDEAALETLQQILLFRELAFSLQEIKMIISSPHFDKQKALAQQIELLTLQKEHLENLIRFAQDIQEKGVNYMDYKAFDTRKIDAYRQAAKEKWGQTDTWREFEEKAKDRTKEDERLLGNDLMQLFVAFGAMKHLEPSSTEV